MLLLLPENKKCPKCDHLISRGIYAPLISERKCFIHCNQCHTRLMLDHEKRRDFMSFVMLFFLAGFIFIPEGNWLYGLVIALSAIVGSCDAFLPYRTSAMFPLAEYHEDKNNILS